MIKKLDHVNIRTRQLSAMVEFYERALKLTVGPRPDFAIAGAWLYCNGDAVIHLVHVNGPLQNEHLQLEHFALKGEDFDQTRAHLVKEKVPHRVSSVPGYELTQIHMADIDDNHIELNFDGIYN